MSTLVYRGLKSSRAKLGIGLILTYTALLMAQSKLGMTNEALRMWSDFVMVVYATYGLSEVGAKGAEAYQTKGTPNGPAS